MKQLIGFSAGHFQTTSTEQWPSEMCKWIAGEILGSFLQKTSQKETIIVTATEGAGDKLDNVGFPVSKPEGRKLVGGMGEPRFCHTPGNQGLFMTEQVWLRWDAGMWGDVFGQRTVFGRRSGKRQCSWCVSTCLRGLTWIELVLRWQSKGKMVVL